MCTMTRRAILKKLFAAAALVSTAALGTVMSAQSPVSKPKCNHEHHAGPGYCTVSGCGCPGFIDVGSSVCGRCYHSYNMHW
jgi:hypothetical protein